MAQYDLAREELEHYRSAQLDPPDFDSFWQDTLEQTRRHDLALRIEEVHGPVTAVRVFDVSFRGYGGDEIRGWLKVPSVTVTAGAAVVQFHGYSGGRGEAIENLLWSNAGYVHLVMDTRGQGWNGFRGVTADTGSLGNGTPGRLTQGIASRETYYYRRVFTDAVRAIEAVRTLDFVDPTRVAALGTSQGGGITLAAAGLVPDLKAVVARVPFLCDFPRAIRLTDNPPYRELATYLALYRRDAARVETEVLPYFDGVNFARRASAPALISVALMDRTCPPSTVYAAHNAYGGPTQLACWEFNDHEGGGVDDDLLTLEHLQRHLR